eukprot:109074_1
MAMATDKSKLLNLLNKDGKRDGRFANESANPKRRDDAKCCGDPNYFIIALIPLSIWIIVLIALIPSSHSFDHRTHSIISSCSILAVVIGLISLYSQSYSKNSNKLDQTMDTIRQVHANAIESQQELSALKRYLVDQALSQKQMITRFQADHQTLQSLVKTLSKRAEESQETQNTKIRKLESETEKLKSELKAKDQEIAALLVKQKPLKPLKEEVEEVLNRQCIQELTTSSQDMGADVDKSIVDKRICLKETVHHSHGVDTNGNSFETHLKREKCKSPTMKVSLVRTMIMSNEDAKSSSLKSKELGRSEHDDVASPKASDQTAPRQLYGKYESV